MNVIIRWSALVLLLLAQSTPALARGFVTFNNQPFVDTDKVESSPAYGQYRPSQFSDDHQVVLVSWNSEEGRKRFSRSQYNNDFFQLAHHYQPQANPLYCGIASSVIVLNSIRTAGGRIPNQPSLSVMKPKELGGGIIPYPLYSQSSLLNDDTDKVKAREIIELKNISSDGSNDIRQLDPGLKLAELKGILERYRLAVTKYPADADIQSGAQPFREMIKSVLSDDRQFILVNYKSDLLGQLGSGHISPLGAYDEESDSVLVLDVAGYQNPWLWIPVYDLYAAMHTKDGDTYRGYLVVNEAADE